MNILAIGAHFDDIELGCGGTLARHSRNGDNVLGFVATTSGFADKNGRMIRMGEVALEEARHASKLIGYRLLQGDTPTFYLEAGEDIQKKLVKMIEENQIDIIYTHWTQDIHHDHRNLALSTLHAARHINKLLMYRSNWYVSDVNFHENFFVDITDTWKIKEEAIRNYHSEMQRVGDSWITYFKQDAVNNGLKIGTKYAEAFQVVRWTI